MTTKSYKYINRLKVSYHHQMLYEYMYSVLVLLMPLLTNTFVNNCCKYKTTSTVEWDYDNIVIQCTQY